MSDQARPSPLPPVLTILRILLVFSVWLVVMSLLIGPVRGMADHPGPLWILVGLLSLFVFSMARAAWSLSGDLLLGRYVPEAPSGRTTPRRGRAMGMLLLLLSTALTLGVAEAVFRTFLPQPLYAIQFTTWGWWHRPNTCIVHGAEPSYEGRLLRGTEFVTTVCYNSLGLRGPERPLEKPSGVRRVVVLGDSYAEAMEVEYDQTAAAVLERLLNARLPAMAAAQRASPRTAPPSADDPQAPDPLGRAIWRRLHHEATARGAALMAANVHYLGSQKESRRSFLESSGVYWVDLSLNDIATERDRYHFRHDGHWNVAGNERAANLMADRIIAAGLLTGDAKRVEVLNAGESGYSLCKQLRVFQEVASHYQPDLVVVVYTGSDGRNQEDTDICQLQPTGSLVIGERRYGPTQIVAREVRSWIKTNSHFGTWVLGRLDTLPLFAELRRILLQPQDVRQIER